MNLRRLFLICAAIAIIGALVTILEILLFEDNEYQDFALAKEPIEYEVLLPDVVGGTPPEPEEPQVLVNEEMLNLLANVIDLEAGSNACTDELQRAVGSVVINRVASPLYPDTMKEVVYQPGQYSTAGRIATNTPSDRALKNAEYLLLNGSTIDDGYLYQANFRQGVEIMQIQNLYFGKHK